MVEKKEKKEEIMKERKIGDTVRLKGSGENDPIMVVNSKRMGKFECIWFENQTKEVKSDDRDEQVSEPLTGRYVLKRAFIHSDALESAEK